MFKNAIFRMHWFLGITAGVVLAVVGITGAMLSYEAPILKAVNAGVITVEVAGRTPLPADELLAKIAAAEPGKSITSVTLSGTPGDSARVGFAAPAGAPPGPGGRPRGESRDVDTNSRALEAAPRGGGVLRNVKQIHPKRAAPP
ncbi:MAG: PepSY domain-containing protein, partial [Arenimonas sp.]|uniref:PepSY domain-containing protein n=1 Tax=Arenimonas sp. TaxID=1872635 RepID=UPI0025C4D2FC